MHIFIDESGSFSNGSLGVVAALSICSSSLPKLMKKYKAIRTRLPKFGGEVKGKLLSEPQVAEVVLLLVRNNAILEVTAIDVAAHTPAAVLKYKNDLAYLMQERVPRFAPSVQPEVNAAIEQIRRTSVPLFLQAMTAWDVLEQVIAHIPMYFAQRQPKELGKFAWIVDGKEPTKTTDWERWWPHYAAGALASRSKNRPMPYLAEADYSYFDAFNGRGADHEGTDLVSLFADFQFSSKPEPGLELVDIIVNAIRRAMLGNLGIDGWRDIPRLMIHRQDQYVGLVMLEGAGKAPLDPLYGPVIRQLSRGGKQMLSPKFLQLADEQERAHRMRGSR